MDINKEQPFENKLVLSVVGKKKYLSKLVGKMIKIVYLIEEEKETGNTPEHYIYGQLIEMNSANQLFDGELTDLIVKLNYVYGNYDKVKFKEIKRQIFEINSSINHLLKALAEEGEDGEDN